MCAPSTIRAARRLGAALAALALSCACSSPGASAPLPVPLDPDPLLPGWVEARPDGGQVLADIAMLERTGRRKAAAIAVRRERALVLAGVWRGLSAEGDRALLASALDRTQGTAVLDAGWRAMLEDRRHRADAYEDYDVARERLLAALRRGDLARALSECPLPEPDGAAARCMAVASQALEGFVLREAGRAAEAAQRFASARRAAAEADALSRARLWLLEHEALGVDAAPAAPEQHPWTLALDLAGRNELVDPIFWQRALESRPASAPWPAAAVEFARASVAPESGEDESSEVLLEGLVATQRADVGDARAGLVGFTHAAAQAREPRTRVRLRAGQARCVIALGRAGEAAALLAECAGDSDPLTARPALAMLGAIELELVRPERALALLEHAVGAQDEPPWQGRSEALANLGLCRLMLGQVDAGLADLRQARALFALDGDVESVGRCLRNELRHAMQARDDRAIESLQAELAVLGN